MDGKIQIPEDGRGGGICFHLSASSFLLEFGWLVS